MQQIGQVFLRVILGGLFAIHGFMKFQGGISNIVGYFDSLSIPGFIAYFVAIVELVGGVAMILGLGSRIIGALFAIIMLGAIMTAKWSLGLLGADGIAGYEFELALLAMSVYFVFATPTPLSVDALLKSKK